MSMTVKLPPGTNIGAVERDWRPSTVGADFIRRNPEFQQYSSDNRNLSTYASSMETFSKYTEPLMAETERWKRESRSPKVDRSYHAEVQRQMVDSGYNTLPSKLSKSHKLPSAPPTRAAQMFLSLSRGLRECRNNAEEDITNLRSQPLEDSQLDLTAAERHLKKLSFQINRISELHSQFEQQLRHVQTFLRQKHADSIGELAYRDSTMEGIESQLESSLGYFHCELKGIVGFARVCPKDTYDVQIRYGSDKWKSRCKVGGDRSQVWDSPSHTFKALLSDNLEIKVSEVKALALLQLLAEKSCDTVDLFSPNPQLMTISLNRNGSIKLNMVVTWQPFASVESSSTTDSPWTFRSNPQLLRSVASAPGNIGKRQRPITIHSSTFQLPNTANEGVKMLPKRPEHSPSASETDSGLSSGNTKNDSPTLSGLLIRDEMPLRNVFTRKTLAQVNLVINLVQNHLIRFPDLQSLVQKLLQIETAIQNQFAMGNRLEINTNLIDRQDFRPELSDSDDLDVNIITNDFSQIGLSRTLGHSYMGANRSTPNSPATSGPHWSYRNKSDSNRSNKPQRRKSAGSVLEAEAKNLVENLELDQCISHHLAHCELLVQRLALVGPLIFRQSEAIHKLRMEAVILDSLLKLMENPIFDVHELLGTLNVPLDLRNLWLSCTENSLKLTVFSNSFVSVLKRNFENFVIRKYPELRDKVFNKILYNLTDRRAWNPDFISLPQFYHSFKDRNLSAHVESIAHEIWIVEALTSGNPNSVRYIVEKLKSVPVTPPPDVIRNICVLLVQPESREIQAISETYLLSARGSLRNDLINTFLAFLEHDDTLTRCGSCRALAIIGARRSVDSLAFVCTADKKTAVREEASRSLMSFGREGQAVLDRLRYHSDRNFTKF